jgi:hypothetical protein
MKLTPLGISILAATVVLACGDRTPVQDVYVGPGPNKSCSNGQLLCDGYCLDGQTDPNNCGGCGKTCSAGTCVGAGCVCPSGESNCSGTFSDGRCFTVLVPDAIADEVTIDSVNAYWLTPDSIVSIGLCGGTPITLSSSLAIVYPEEGYILADEAYVYWSGRTSSGNIMARTRSDGGGSTSVIVRSDVAYEVSFKIDETSIYWVSDDGGSLIRTPKSGGESFTLHREQGVIGPIAIDDHSIYWSTQLSGTETLSSMPKTGGPVTILVGPPGGFAYLIAVGATSVYFAVNTSAGYYGADLLKVPLEGGARFDARQERAGRRACCRL